ncbi:60Kd inner membrane protein-domain-containing protein [Infundibulicybe gibba]|nr:60Kd inner membrane protein-domain-containing protein [Infundibulicybe gibba]
MSNSFSSGIRHIYTRIPGSVTSQLGARNCRAHFRPFSLACKAPSLPRNTFRSSIFIRNYTKPVPGTPAATLPVDAPAVPVLPPATNNESVPSAVESIDPSTPTDALLSTDLIDTALAHLPPALQYGDLAALGLVGWTPAGLIRWSYELINVSTGLPWFYTIVLGSLFWKLVLVPLSVQGLRNSARLLPLQPQIVQSQDEMKRIRASGDKLALQKHALKMRKMYKDAGVNMGATALTPFVQIPVTLGLFFGVKKMCELPVIQLTHSGLDMLPDLTVADPYMILPVALCAAVNMQITVGASELNLKERPEMGHIMNGLRVLSVLGIYVMSSFPSGLMVSLLVTSFATTAQSLAFQYPPIRRALDIPTVPVEMRGRLPSPMSTVNYMINMYKNKVAEATAAQQQSKISPRNKRR